MERLREDVDRHNGQLDDHLKRIGYLEAETERTRRRLHRQESDRAAVRLLVRTTQQLAEQTRVLAEKVSDGIDRAEGLAESAAEKAVQKLAERRAKNRWKLILRVSTVAGAIGAFGFLIAYAIWH